MHKLLRFIALAILTAAAVTIWDGFFILPEGQQAVITQFGAPVGKSLTEAGLKIKTPFIQQVQYLTARVTIPVIVDADTGFGDTANVERTIVELERAGAAAIQLEDQELPKRC